MAEPKSSGRRVLGDLVRNNLASGLAILVSLISLGVAVSSNRTQERLLAASAWPALELETGNRSDDGSHEIIFVLGNNGVGPARLRGVQLFYKGEFIGDSRQLLKHCCVPVNGPVSDVTSGTRGRVLKAGDQVKLLTLPKVGNDEEMWKRLDRARVDVTARACYCSVLDDCWIFESTRMDPEPVRSCPALPVDEEWSG